MHMCFASTTSGNFTTLQTFGTPKRGWMLIEEATYTTTSPTVIPGEHHLDRDETLVTLPGMGEHHPALLLDDWCHLLWHCGVVHCHSVAWERDTA